MAEKAKKFNIIDILIAAAVVAVAVVGVFAGGGKQSDNTETAKKLVTLEITEKHIGFGENVTAGDKVTEKVDKKQIGEVIGAEVKPCEKNSYDRITGAPTVAVIPERENVYVTMRIDNDANVAVGKQLSIITKHFSGHGYVTEVRPEE